jgi:two-component system nitrate/nitrite response regulator NarL
LSARELEVLKFLVTGDSSKVIARTCNLVESTVKIRLKTILRKIRVRNRTQAAIWAMQHANGGEAASPA